MVVGSARKARIVSAGSGFAADPGASRASAVARAVRGADLVDAQRFAFARGRQADPFAEGDEARIVAQVQDERIGRQEQQIGGRSMLQPFHGVDRKSTRLNSSHPSISYAVFCLKKKKTRL